MYQYAEQTFLDNKRYKLIVNIIIQIPKIVVKNYPVVALSRHQRIHEDPRTTSTER